MTPVDAGTPLKNCDIVMNAALLFCAWIAGCGSKTGLLWNGTPDGIEAASEAGADARDDAVDTGAPADECHCNECQELCRGLPTGCREDELCEYNYSAARF